MNYTGDTSQGSRPSYNSSFAPWVVLALLAAFWAVFLAFSSPDFGGTDAFIFRDAGCNCARGMGLVSESVPNDPLSVPPKLFAAYTPGAPLLYAPFARLFGCGSRADTYYNYLLLLLLSILLLWFYTHADVSPKRRLWAAGLIGATLPGGLFLSDLDRPETVALIAALVLILLWITSRKPLAKILLMGCSGLVFLIHPYVGIVLFLLMAFLLLTEKEKNKKIFLLAAGAVLAAVPVIILVLMARAVDPTAIPRFLGHAFGAGSGAGVILKDHSTAAAHPGFLHNYLIAGHRYFNTNTILSGSLLFSLICSFLLCTWLLIRRRANKREMLQLACLFAILFLFPAAIFLAQRNYFGASGVLLFASVTIGGYGLSERLRNSAAPLGLLLIAALFSLPQFVLHVTALCELHSSYLRASRQAARVQKIFNAQGIAEPRLLIDSRHYFVYKPYFRYLYNMDYLEAGDSTSPIQGTVLCYMASTAFEKGRMKMPPYFEPGDWVLIDSDFERDRITLFGHPIQRRNWAWTCDVYERKNSVPANAALPPQR